MSPWALCSLAAHLAVGRWWWRSRPRRQPGRQPGSRCAGGRWPRRGSPLATAAAVAAVGVAGVVAWGPWGVGAALAVPMVGWVRRRRAERRRAERLEHGVAALIVLCELCLHSGVSLRRALGEVAPWLPADLRDILSSTLRRDALGAGLGAELDRAAALHPPLAGFARLVVSTERYGESIGPALAALAADARREQRHRLERRARRVPVQLLGPLIVGVLPAFVLLSVVPLLAVALADLSLGGR